MLAIASLFFLGTVPTTVARENHNRTEFVPNPQCTIGDDWDPDVDDPSDAALMELAPSGTLRLGVYYGNVAIAQLDPATGLLHGTAIDVACRMATQLKLPLEFYGSPSIPEFLAAFRTGKWEIGFALDPNLGVDDATVAHPYIGIENTYLVPIDSPFMSVDDVDQPGIQIAVAQGTSPDVYLTAHLQFATLVRTVDTPAAFQLIRDGLVDAVAAGRAAEVMFVESMWQGQGRVLPDNFFVPELGPFMHLKNPDGVCYLTDYVEGAKKSGLLAEAIARSGTTIGRIVPAPLPACQVESNRVWFTDINESRIFIFDADTNTLIRTIGDDIEHLNGPFFVAFNRLGTLAFVTQGVLRRMNIYDTSDYTLIGSVDGGSDLNGIDVTGDGLYAYVVAPTAEHVLVVQTSSPFGVVTSIPVGPTAYWVQLTPDGSEAWVTNQNGHITIIDTSSAAVVGTIEGACSHPKTLRFTSIQSDDGSASDTGESDERVFAYMGCVGGSPTGDPEDPGTVVRLDVAARSVDTTYYFANDATGVPSPRFLAALPGKDVVYATDYLRNELHKIVDGEYAGSYSLPSSCLGPLGVESRPDGARLFIACFTDFDTTGRGSEVMWNTKTDTAESDYVTGGRLIGVGINRAKKGDSH